MDFSGGCSGKGDIQCISDLCCVLKGWNGRADCRLHQFWKLSADVVCYCPEEYELKKRAAVKREQMFNILMRAHKRSSMLSCSLNPDPRVLEAKTNSGLVRGHAYSITKVGDNPLSFSPLL